MSEAGGRLSSLPSLLKGLPWATLGGVAGLAGGWTGGELDYVGHQVSLMWTLHAGAHCASIQNDPLLFLYWPFSFLSCGFRPSFPHTAFPELPSFLFFLAGWLSFLLYIFLSYFLSSLLLTCTPSFLFIS